MPRQVPSLAVYQAANPYKHLKSSNTGYAWDLGASDTLRTVGPYDGPVEAAYLEGCNWRRQWEAEHNPNAGPLEKKPALSPNAAVQVVDPLSRTPDALLPHHKAMKSTKSYNAEVGLSCAFRQWRAASHCSFLHGYALGFKFVFACSRLDENGWVVDFGACKGLKEMLAKSFDHKTLVAADDPMLPLFEGMHANGAIDLHIVPATGCEAFARIAHSMAESWLYESGLQSRVWLVSVEVSEHGGNSAICEG